MPEPTLRTKLINTAREYADIYMDYIANPIADRGRFIKRDVPLDIETPPLHVLEKIESLHTRARNLLSLVPVPEGHSISLDIRAVFKGALILTIRDNSNRIVSDIYIKSNGGIRFEDPRHRGLDEMAIMQAIDGGPGQHK